MRKMIREGTGQPEPVYNPVKEEKEEIKNKENKVTFNLNQENKLKEKHDDQNLIKIEKVSALKKKKLPAWAKTAEKYEEEELEDDDKLIEFMDSLDVEQYLEDVEFKTMLATLKKKVTDLKGEPDWREKWKKRLKEKTEKRKKEYIEQKEKNKVDRVKNNLEDDDDNLSVMGSRSVFSDAGKSIASSKTQGIYMLNYVKFRVNSKH